jgi:hypothetical protein
MLSLSGVAEDPEENLLPLRLFVRVHGFCFLSGLFFADEETMPALIEFLWRLHRLVIFKSWRAFSESGRERKNLGPSSPLAASIDYF